MADYKELIRKAIQALPENNGAARRAVYEKARAALVGQLRGLNPPLAARDITQHRLQLEDCIRQVEQEASEAVIAGLKQNEELPPPAAALPPPRPASMTPPRAANAPRPAATLPRPAVAPAAARQAAAAGRPQPAAVTRPGAAAAGPRAAPAAAPAPANRPGIAAKTQPMPRVAAAQSKAAVVMAAMPAGRPSPAARSLSRAQTATYPRAVPAPEPEPEPEDVAENRPDESAGTIEEIIAAAEGDSAMSYDNDEEGAEAPESAPEPPTFKLEPRAAAKKPALAPPAAPRRLESRPLPAIVARAEAAKSGRPGKPAELPRRANGAEARREIGPPPRLALPGRDPTVEPLPTRPRIGNAAMSSVREVELESEPVAEGDPQVAIERAIATLEREARNDEDAPALAAESEAPNGRAETQPRRRQQTVEKPLREAAANSDAVFARAPVEAERGGGSAVTIFLLVFLVLLIGAGGAGFWAWREGFVDFDAMFGKAQTVAEQTVSPPAAAPRSPSMITPKTVKTVPVPGSTTQTNTEPAANTPAQSAEAMSAAPAPVTTPPAAAPAPNAAEPSAQNPGGPKSEDRLTPPSDSAAAPAPNAGKPADNGAPAASSTGSQSLLLEASQDGTTGAVPFSGTVEWSQGKDELGQPTLVGKADIPARNLGVAVLIRKNADATLPASHLMEITFSVNDSFIGGAISGLPGVLMKNEELVQGTPLVGASARVVGNQFLFALSSSTADEATNKDLLTSRKWMDLAIIYATGKKAIITLEKDDKSEALFNQVFAAWDKEPATAAAK